MVKRYLSRFIPSTSNSTVDTSIDPSEQYIPAEITNVREAAKTGNEKILSDFRELPAPSRAKIVLVTGDASTEAIG
ncbi:NrpR regulatory domain-containing protein [Chloroflexota bacterium]